MSVVQLHISLFTFDDSDDYVNGNPMHKLQTIAFIMIILFLKTHLSTKRGDDERKERERATRHTTRHTRNAETLRLYENSVLS